MQTLIIYLQDEKVGVLSVNAHQQMQFQYDANWLKHPHAIPLSIGLPLTKSPFDDKATRAYFANLLPEGVQRLVIAKYFDIAPSNDFALLAALARECAGAVSNELKPSSSEYQLLDDESLSTIIKHSLRRPLEAMRFTLAGAQTKFVLYKKDQQLSLPLGGAPSTHIVKPEMQHFPASVTNEAFCMTLAQRLGLPVPHVNVYLDPIKLYCVERYDRVWCNEKLIRLHQEDFCQALGFLPTQKIESEGGPNLAQCFALITKYSVHPVIDKKHLIQWLMFNYLIGNADGHAKNISLLFLQDGPRLAPFYDLFCTEVYSELSTHLPMRIGKAEQYEELQVSDWEYLAGEIKINRKFVLNLLKDMSEEIVIAAESVMRDFVKKVPEDAELLQKIYQVIINRKNQQMSCQPALA